MKQNNLKYGSSFYIIMENKKFGECENNNNRNSYKSNIILIHKVIQLLENIKKSDINMI